VPATSVDTSGTYAAALRRRRYTTALTRAPDGREAVPPVASQRAYLRGNLPALYQQNGDFGLRLLGALEHVLDPIVALIDALPAHVSAGLAPLDLLDLFAAWLGVELDESWPPERRRELIRRAPELARRRGTRTGLELTLKIAFPDLPLRIEESGGITFGEQPAKRGKGGGPELVVYCDQPIDEARQAAVARVIDGARPVHVSYRLRVKATTQRG
jgi:phage tail-like protein